MSRMASELFIGDVSDDALEEAAFELGGLASHIGWTDAEREAEYHAIRDHLLELRSGEGMEHTRNPHAVDLLHPDSTPECVSRRRLLRHWIQREHDERRRLPASGQVTQPIHIRPEEVGEA